MLAFATLRMVIDARPTTERLRMVAHHDDWETSYSQPRNHDETWQTVMNYGKASDLRKTNLRILPAIVPHFPKRASCTELDQKHLGCDVEDVMIV